MSSLLFIGGGLVFFILGYIFYAGRIARAIGLGKSAAPTPAHTMNDGVDYVPARLPVLLGHHFASIAGAAPIIGPILAAQFGWAPVYIWILIGGVFLGAVHDFMSLVASVRHEGRSIGTIIERYLGRSGKILFLLFAWSTLLLVVAVFTLVVARTFVTTPAVATASLLFIVLAVAFGLSVYRFKANFIAASAVGVVLLGICLHVGVLFPFPRLLTLGDGPDPMLLFWQVILLVYIFVASVTPVNILLQPRDYLNSFLLYAMLGLALIAIIISPPAIKGEAFVAFSVKGLGPIFPILFVTVACGAISGFHSMVASGTTAKQLDRESDAKAVGYGGMLIESTLALIALLTAVVVTRSEHLVLLQGGPVHVFSSGLASFISVLGIPLELGISFAGLAVSAFALTSLDTATRLARFTLQELVMRPERPLASQPLLSRNRYFATAITVGAGGLLLLSGKTMSLWKIFGSANQLLAALALMAVTVWLAAQKRPTRYTFIPMILMYCIAVCALVFQGIQLLQEDSLNLPLLVLVILLFVLSILLAYNYVMHRLRTPRSGVQTSARE
jgi:carbon starvation protein